MWRSAPFLVFLVLIGAAALAIGADTPAAALFFAGSISGLSALILLFYRRPIGGLALLALTGAGGLFAVGLAKGWASTGAGEYAVLAAAFGLFAAAQIAGRDGRTLETLWQASVALGCVLAGASFVDFIIDPAYFWGIVERPYGGNRFSTPFLSANTAATFYGLIAIMSLAELIRVVRRFEPGARGAVEGLSKSGALPVVGLLLSLTCVFLTASRGGATFLAGALLLLASWELFRGVSGGRRLDLKSAGVGLFSVALVALAFAVSGDLYADRIVESGGQDTARAAMFEAYWEALWLAPMLGHGLGGFVFVSALIADADNAPLIMFQGAAHNVAFQWLLQGGVVGLVFVITVSGAWLLMMRRGLARRSRQTGYMRAAVVAALFVAAHGMVDYALEIPAFLFLFAWVCGLSAGVATGGSRTIGIRAGAKALRATTLATAGLLAIAAALSFWTFADRASAISIAGLEDDSFQTLFTDENALSGSAVRLEAIGDRAVRLDPPSARLASVAFARAVEREPRDGVLEAKRAYALYLDAGRLTPEAAAALTRSYFRTPYGTRDFASWRLDFLEAIWPSLPVSLREAAIREARAYGQTGRIERLTAEADRL